MLFHLFQILLFLRCYKQSITKDKTYQITPHYKDVNYTRNFKNNLSILWKACRTISKTISKNRYNLKKEQLQELETEVDYVHTRYLAFKKLLIRKFIPEKDFDEFQYIKQFSQFKTDVLTFTKNPKDFIRRERKIILKKFKRKYNKAIDEFNSDSQLWIYYQDLVEYVNDLYVENDRYCFEVFKSRMHAYERRYNSLKEIFDFVRRANKNVKKIVLNKII